MTTSQTFKFWLPAITGMFCLGLGAGLIGVYGFFVQPLAEEFGVGAAVISAGPIALVLVPGIVAPFVGRLADRLPIRRMALIGAAISMCALLAITRAPTLLTVGLFFFLFSFGLTFYGPVVINGLMVKLYPGREARATAIVAIGISLASASLPPLMGYLMSLVDWRTALACLALGVLVVLCPLVWLGLPAGVIGTVAQGGSKLGADISHSREFWLVGLCVAMGLGVSIVLAVVYPPHFVAEGYTLRQAGGFLALAGMAGLVGKLSVAWIGDRGHLYAKWLASAALLIQMIGFALLMMATTAGHVMCALVLLGFGGGAFIPMHPYLNSRYFDASRISQVIGAQMPLFLPIVLVGAPLAGYVYDRTGSYDMVFIGMSALLLIAMMLALRLPRPQA